MVFQLKNFSALFLASFPKLSQKSGLSINFLIASLIAEGSFGLTRIDPDPTTSAHPVSFDVIIAKPDIIASNSTTGKFSSVDVKTKILELS